MKTLIRLKVSLGQYFSAMRLASDKKQVMVQGHIERTVEGFDDNESNDASRTVRDRFDV